MPFFESLNQKKTREEKEALAEHNPWSFDSEGRTISRIRELQLKILENQDKMADETIRLADDLLSQNQDDSLFSERNDESEDEGGPVFHSKREEGQPQSIRVRDIKQPTEELLVEDAFMLMFSPWGWDEVYENIGRENMADDYKNLAVKYHVINPADDEAAQALADLLFFNEMDITFFMEKIKELWRIDETFVAKKPVKLVPTSDGRIEDEEFDISKLSLGSYLGKVKLLNNAYYNVFINPYKEIEKPLNTDTPIQKPRVW